MKILITGGTGSLGRALIRKLKTLYNDINMEIIVYSRDEGKQALYFGQDKDIIRVIGDVRDFDKLNLIFKLHKPDYVIHTGALKRIDDMEFYPDECIKTNIQGSDNVARAALKHNVRKCILISTDKACSPINVYGASKFIAERTFTNYDFMSTSTIFASVRYGNVIASRGSFIPLWMDLLSQGKTINVTSLDCTRFLFTLNDAVDTVLSSLETAQGGEVFIPQLSSYKMGSIIEAVAQIKGINDINYNIIGMRPGEKFHEDMLAVTELPFTYDVDNKLLAVLPQYTKRSHSYNTKYIGDEFNSATHIKTDVNELAQLINRGLLDANE